MLGTRLGCAGEVPRGVCCCVTAMRACLRPSELTVWGRLPLAWWRCAGLDLPCSSHQEMRSASSAHSAVFGDGAW